MEVELCAQCNPIYVLMCYVYHSQTADAHLGAHTRLRSTPGQFGSTPGKTSFCVWTDSVFDAGDLRDHAGVPSSRVRARLDVEEDFEVLGQLLFLFVRRV